MTSNETLRDEAIKHAVYLRAYSTRAAFDAVKLLKATEADLLLQIINAGDSPRLSTLFATLKQVNAAAYAALYAHFQTQGMILAAHESKHVGDAIYAATFETIQPNIAAPSVIFAAVTERPFEGMLLKEWIDKLDASRMERVAAEIRMGIVEGETTAKIIQRIRGTRAMAYKDGALEMSRRSAAALAQTYTQHVANAAREAVFLDNPRIIKKVQWLSTLDNLTCIVCGPLDGQVFAPGVGLRPPAHVNCRCTSVAVTRAWREMGINRDEISPSTRASMNGQVPATETYSTWLAKQPASFQDHVLGKGKGELYRAGAPLERFTDIRGHELTLDQLRAL